MATVKVILKKEKANKKGECPIYIRITVKRKTQQISTGYTSKPLDWDEIHEKAKKSHPNATRLNNYLLNKRAEALNTALELETTSKDIKATKIKEKIIGASSSSFFQYAQEYSNGIEVRGTAGTHRRTKTVIEKFKNYRKGIDLQFDDFTVDLLKKYEIYLLSTLGNSVNTVQANFKLIRTILNSAVSEGKLTYDKNPFLQFKLKSTETKREALTESELKKVEDLALPEGSLLALHRDIFVFSVYTAGLRISDTLQLRWENINGDRIFIKIHKTQKPLSIKLINKLNQILEKLKAIHLNETKQKKAIKRNFVFPVLKRYPESSSKLDFNYAISSATAHINKSLKIIATMAKVEKRITCHVSRHTYATIALTKGVRIEAISKLLGHASLKETQIYAKMVNAELDSAMDIMNEPKPAVKRSNI